MITESLWPIWYVRSNTNIYTSSSGSNWVIDYTAPAGNYNAISRAVVPRKLWAVRSNGGISCGQIYSGINKTGNEIPDKFALFQNYPNPFNPVTNIKFQVPVEGLVTLKVFDALGREIKILVNEMVKSGVYEATFNAENLSSGVYFYKLVTDKFSDVKKMVVIK